MNALWWILPGMLVGLGVALCATAFRTPHPRLADALAALDASTVQTEAVGQGPWLGRWWVRTRRVVASPELERQLRLRGRTLVEHQAIKIGGAIVGLLLPVGVGLTVWLATGNSPAVPLLLGPVVGVVAYLLPDVLLRGEGRATDEDATEALLTFFDLVTLERLGGQSGTQSLHAAAELSDVPVFGAVRGALERARFQQRAPYADLRVLSRELELPALGDLADVMRLDETGAALSVALRARVRELRDAHLTQMKLRATEVSERMTLWMVIPSLVFGLVFLVPPLLTLVTSG